MAELTCLRQMEEWCDFATREEYRLWSNANASTQLMIAPMGLIFGRVYAICCGAEGEKGRARPVKPRFAEKYPKEKKTLDSPPKGR